MTKSSQARIMRKKNEKLREKAKKMILKEYPNLIQDKEARKKTFQAVDNANVAVDKNGKVQILYEQNNDNLMNLK